MAKSQNGPSGNGQVRDVSRHYWTPKEGAETVADAFADAHGAVFIGHRTFANVPFDRPCREGDTMTAAQAAFLSGAIIRASLGNDDYPSVDAAAAIKVRDIPAQYSALEDAVDNVVCKWLTSSGRALGKRADREVHVARVLSAKLTQKFKGMPEVLGALIPTEGKRLTNEPKKVKGTSAVTTDMGVSIDNMFDE